MQPQHLVAHPFYDIHRRLARYSILGRFLARHRRRLCIFSWLVHTGTVLLPDERGG